MEGSGTGSNYIITLEFIPEAINCAIVLVFIVDPTLVVALILAFRFCVAAAPRPLPLTSANGIFNFY